MFSCICFALPPPQEPNFSDQSRGASALSGGMPVFDVTVSFLIVPENYVIKEVFASDVPVVHIRNTIGSKLKINPQNIDLRFNSTRRISDM